MTRTLSPLSPFVLLLRLVFRWSLFVWLFIILPRFFAYEVKVFLSGLCADQVFFFALFGSVFVESVLV